MQKLGSYLISVAAAAMICGVLQRLTIGKGTFSGIMKILCGIFLLYTVCAPLTSYSFSGFGAISVDFQEDALRLAAEGEKDGNDALRSIISEQLCEYILDKASTYDAQISVSVKLSEDMVPIPVGIEIKGDISPYGKLQLQEIISSDLGIAKENQIWI